MLGNSGFWTIRNRMITVATAALLSIVMLGGLQYYAAASVKESTAAAADIKRAVGTLNQVRLKNVELLLAAMDSIIDRAEGSIVPERAATIDGAVSFIQENLHAVAVLGARSGGMDEGKQIQTDFQALAKAIQSDLKKAIETNAADEAFAKIDDVIDTAGERFAQSLARIDAQASALMEAQFAAANDTVDTAVFDAVLGAAVAIAVFLPLVVLVTRSILQGLSGLTLTMTKLAEGRLDVDVPFTGRRDELGTMAGAVQVFKENAIEIERLRADRERQEQAAAADRRAAMMALSDAFEASVSTVVTTVSSTAHEMGGASGRAVEATREALQEANSVAAATEQTNAAVQAVATAAEELSSSIAEINRQVGESSRITKEASNTAQATNEQVRGLADAAEKIGDVISLIQSIAEQTNLLALNATIEAARAGEAGKGFAVVASEVKSLATQTAKATEDISGQISAIQSATVAAVDAIGRITATTEEINAITSSVAASVEEQGAATDEISRSAQEAARSVEQTSRTIRRVSEKSEETGRTVGNVSQAVGQLNDQFASLRREVETFVGRIRAA